MSAETDDSDSESLSPLTMSGEATFSLACETSTQIFDKSPETLNVIDVYNIASSIGQEFERLTDAFGGVVFSGVMPKIIRVLEILEEVVAKREEETQEITELNASLKHLQMDSKLKDEKQNEEIEIIESAWKDETRGLLETVKSLEEDNQKLTAALTETLEDENDNTSKVPQQSALISKLQEQVSKQRDELRARNSHIEEQARETEALQSQVQRLMKVNVEVRNKIHILEQQGKSLVEQKTDLQAKLNENGRDMAELQLRSIQKDRSGTSQGNKSGNDKGYQSSITETDSPMDPLLANKLVIDLDDPNRPRYTLQELQEVLNDRNQLKARCFLLEEELIFYRGIARKYGIDETWEELNESEIRESKKHADKNQPKPQETGIRRLFSYFTVDTLRRKTEPSKSTMKHQQHEVVDTSIDEELVNANDIKQFVPDIASDESNSNVTVLSEPVSSEMKLMSPVEEIDKFTP